MVAPNGDEKTLVILPEGAKTWRPYKVRECVAKFEASLKDRWPAFSLRVVKVGEGAYNFIFEPIPVEKLLEKARLATEAVQ